MQERLRTKESKYVLHPSCPSSHPAASQRIMDFRVYFSTHVTRPLTATHFAPRRWIVHKISHHVENYTQIHNVSDADYSFSRLIGMQHNISNYCWSWNRGSSWRGRAASRHQSLSIKELVKSGNRWREMTIAVSSRYSWLSFTSLLHLHFKMHFVNIKHCFSCARHPITSVSGIDWNICQGKTTQLPSSLFKTRVNAFG